MMLGCFKDLWFIISLWTCSSICRGKKKHNHQTKTLLRININLTNISHSIKHRAQISEIHGVSRLEDDRTVPFGPSQYTWQHRARHSTYPSQVWQHQNSQTQYPWESHTAPLGFRLSVQFRISAPKRINLSISQQLQQSKSVSNWLGATFFSWAIYQTCGVQV